MKYSDFNEVLDLISETSGFLSTKQAEAVHQVVSYLFFWVLLSIVVYKMSKIPPIRFIVDAVKRDWDRPFEESHLAQVTIPNERIRFAIYLGLVFASWFISLICFFYAFFYANLFFAAHFYPTTINPYTAYVVLGSFTGFLGLASMYFMNEANKTARFLQQRV